MTSNAAKQSGIAASSSSIATSIEQFSQAHPSTGIPLHRPNQFI